MTVCFWLDILLIVNFKEVAKVSSEIKRWRGGGVVGCCVEGRVKHGSERTS